MPRRYLVFVVLAAALVTTALSVPGSQAATASPVHALTVTGTDVAMYPAFDPGTARYGLTTTDGTAGTVTVHATTSDPAGSIWVDIVAPAAGATHAFDEQATSDFG